MHGKKRGHSSGRGGFSQGPVRSWLGSGLLLLGSWQGRRPFQHWDARVPFPSLPTLQGSPWHMGPHTLPTWALTNRSGANLIQTSLNPLKYSISVKGEQSKTSVLFHRRNAPPWGGTSISISDSNRKSSPPGGMPYESTLLLGPLSPECKG